MQAATQGVQVAGGAVSAAVGGAAGVVASAADAARNITLQAVGSAAEVWHSLLVGARLSNCPLVQLESVWCMRPPRLQPLPGCEAEQNFTELSCMHACPCCHNAGCCSRAAPGADGRDHRSDRVQLWSPLGRWDSSEKCIFHPCLTVCMLCFTSVGNH